MKTIITLQPAFREHVHVFSEQNPMKLPPSQFYNHAIELKDLFILKQFKTYSLNSDEQQAYKEFVKEHLKTRRISPSIPLLLCQENEVRKLHSYQDYCYLNSYTIKNTYPLPLISDLINKLQGSPIFTKFNIW